MSVTGKSVPRVDAPDKALGKAKYTADLCPKDALHIRLVRSEIAHGRVLSVDTSEAERVPGVVKVFTCFDVPDRPFPTAGHPWSCDPAHQDIADRLLLERHVRYHGDEYAAVVAETALAAEQGARLVRAEYEEYPFVLDQMEAMRPGAPTVQEAYPDNVLKHTHNASGDWEEAVSEPGLLCIDKWYDTPPVQHCHIENPICYAYMEHGRVVVVSSTQIPHIIRRVVGQALGLPWGKVRIIKPFIGGGFGNKQDALYEPICAWIAQQLDRTVVLDLCREETFGCTRTRHGIRFRLVTWFRRDGTFVARKLESYARQGAYASHGHSIAAKGTSAFAQLYRCRAWEFDAYTIFTNTPAAGAMRAYGIPQVTFAMESHCDDIAKMLGMDPIELRRKNLMEQGYTDAFSGNVNRWPSHEQCMEKGAAQLHWEEKRAEYAKEQTGPLRRGIGMAVFWYNTGVYPISLELSGCRMILNQDGSLQLFSGETEIGQGADTVFAQMAADSTGLRFEDIHVVSTQDTDVHPYGSGAYASRQTYVAGMAIHRAGLALRERILKAAEEQCGVPASELDVRDGLVVGKESGETLITVAALAEATLYSLDHAEQLSAEETNQCRSNAYSFGCCFAEVEVDVPLCRARVVRVMNVHDAGRLINPALAEGQVHGGMSMAIGYGMGEQLLFDPKTGRLLNGNLLDYKLSTAMDHPTLEAGFVENPEPTSPFGVKALGEPPAVPAAAAIRNAVLQATGTAVDRLPLTPQTLFTRFREEGLL